MKVFRMVYYCVFSIFWLGVSAVPILAGLYNWQPLQVCFGGFLASFGFLVLFMVLKDEIKINNISGGEYFTSRELLERDEPRPQTLTPGTDTPEMGRGQRETTSTVIRNVRQTTLCRMGIHRIIWGSVDTGACTQTGACDICGRAYRRGAHFLGMWVYRKPNACDMARACRRCGQFYGHIEEHDWVDHVCRRCGAQADTGQNI